MATYRFRSRNIQTQSAMKAHAARAKQRCEFVAHSGWRFERITLLPVYHANMNSRVASFDAEHLAVERHFGVDHRPAAKYAG